MSRSFAVLLLLVTTMLWGLAFVAQKSAMADMGPLTFAGARYLLGALVLAPLALREWQRRSAGGAPPLSARQWWLILVLSVVFFLGSILQQWGLAMTTATTGGFLTGLYVLFTPLFGWLLFRTRPHPVIVLCVPLALVGLFYLNGGYLDRLGLGDLLVVLCAVFWGLQVLLLGGIARDTGLPIAVSWMNFVFAGVIAAALVPVFEAPSVTALTSGWVQIAYSGILSTAVAFTFQAIAQQHVPPANAAIVLSSESLFAALGGAVILGERLPPVGYAGAGLILVAIVLVEAVPAIAQRRRPLAPVV
jgi:drug/metabolite transporter (DMT)-like permease